MTSVLRSSSQALRVRDAWTRIRLRTARAPAPALTPQAVCRQLESPAADGSAVAVRCIVFSKDRPMQLDACLRSIVRKGPYRGPIIVVYRATTEAFAQGYARLAPDPRVRLVRQGTDFAADVMDALGDIGGHVVFHTDDDVFFRAPPRPPMLPDGCAAFSLRLGENTTYCYPLRRTQRPPEVAHCGEFMVWDWSRADADFAYPLSLNGHVFDGSRLRSLLGGARFENPNELERELHLRRHRVPRLMLSFTESSVVSLPVNVVTESIVNPSGSDPQLAPAVLNERFLRGERIDLDALDFADVRAAHQEIALSFSSPADTEGD